MSSFSAKPDKCAILQETVNQIQQIKQQESGSSEAVQQSQVSSSKPSIATDIIGPLILEALDGFLFVVNSQGLVVFVSDNVTEFLKYSPDDLVGKSIYNIIHVGDHAQFSGSLLPMSVVSGLGWPNENSGIKGRPFNCRMLIKPPYDEDDIETKQTYVSQYDKMQISAVLHPYPSEKFPDSREETSTSDGQSCLVCIARRLPLKEKTNTMLGIEQFTTKLDLSGKILDFDASGINPNHYTYPDFVGQKIQDFSHINDIHLLTKHLQEVLKTSNNTSSVYRFKIQENRYVFIKTKSKLYSNPVSGDEFITSTHTIIKECDSESELKGSASTSLKNSVIGQPGFGPNRGHSLAMNSALSSLGITGNRNPFNSQTSNSTNLNIQDSSVFSDIDFQSGNNNWDTLDLNSIGGNLRTTSTNSIPPASNTWGNIGPMSMTQGPLQQVEDQTSTSGSKRPKSLNFPQKGNSFENNGIKSQGFPPNMNQRNAGFQIPNSSAGLLGLGNKRTPTSAPPKQQDPFSYQQLLRTSSPSLSQALSQSVWNSDQSLSDQKFPSSISNNQNLLQTVPSFDSQANLLAALSNKSSRTNNNEFRFSSGSEGLPPSERKYPAKLSQLLTSNTVNLNRSSYDKKDSYLAKQDSVNNAKSPLDSMLQSPQPGPGQSPQEKPQSTSNEDDLLSAQLEVGRDLDALARKKVDNALLKHLLSRDDEEEHSSDSGNDSDMDNNDNTREDSEKGDGLSNSLLEMEKNEAEPKKPNNILLKQLLSEREKDELENKDAKATSELLQKLLQEKDFDITSAPAESTSQDSPGERSRHTSESQEPQPSTSEKPPALGRSVTGSSSFAQAQSTIESNILSELFPVENGVKSSDSVADRNLQNFLNVLWERESSTSSSKEVEPSKPVKRKISATDLQDVDGADSTDNISLGLGSIQSSKLSQKNVLLAKLLSKNAPRETVVNTQITLNPTAVPQQRLPKNIGEKLIQVKTERQSSDSANEMENKIPNSRDNPRNNPNTPFPGNTSLQPSAITEVNETLGFSKSDNVDSSNARGQQSGNNGGQFQNQYEQLQQLLSQANAEKSESPDPLLKQIMDQVHSLQDSFPGGNTGSAVNTGGSNQPSVIDELDQLLADPSMIGVVPTDLGSLLDSNNPANDPLLNMSEHDKMAIDAIQKQLMSEDPVHPVTSQTPSSMSTSGKFSSTTRNPDFIQNVLGTQQQQHQQLHPQQQQQHQHQQVNQAGSVDMFASMMDRKNQPNFSKPSSSGLQQPGPRMPQPQGLLASALQGAQQRPALPNMNPTSTAMQVRRSLLQQQRIKQMREAQKQRQQQQEHQRQILMQQRQPFNRQYSQPFPTQMGLESPTMQPPPFPENLNEIMNSGNAPNVTIQRSQSIPGQMSPHYNSGTMQQPSPSMMGPSTPSPQLSPHFPSQQNHPSQWNGRPTQQSLPGPMAMSQGNQYGGMQRHRSLSGNAIPNQPGQNSSRFQFPDSQFPGNQSGQMGLFGQQQGVKKPPPPPQQQQQMFPQNRTLQRQISMPPGRGSPRTPLSPYVESTDPMLLSPHSVSPSSIRQSQTPKSQISPPFSQVPFSPQTVSVPSTYSGTPMSSAAFQQPSMSGSGQNTQGFTDFDMQFLDSGFNMDSSKKPGGLVQSDLAMSGAPTSTSQYVKQELRNICNARSEKQVHPQSQPSVSSHPQLQQQQQPQQQQSQQMELDMGELPLEILEQINALDQDHSGLASMDVKEDDIIHSSREEARRRYEQFRQLSIPGPVAVDPVKMPSEQVTPEDKAAAYFRNQLMSANPKADILSQQQAHQRAQMQGQALAKAQQQQQQLHAQLQQKPPSGKGKDMPHVNVIQNKPRQPVEEMKTPDQKNSLLQKLLSE